MQFEKQLIKTLLNVNNHVDLNENLNSMKKK